jgi:YesN/AraC family two-component response regulator
MNVLVDTEQFFQTKEVQKILPALEYVNRNYNEEISLESVSVMLGFGPSYFCRIFKTATGATFTEYLNFVRICKAEKMLARTNNSILEISETVGFSSVSYFNRVFKKYRNCSPRGYRLAEYKNI